MNEIIVSQKLKQLASIFYPTPLYITGGYVRNCLLGLKVSDIDICSSLKPEQVISLIKDTGFVITAQYNTLGTLKIKNGEEDYEYTTFRKEEYIGGNHTPHKVDFCDSLELDAKRRDFTINSIYYDIYNQQIFDPLHGIDDLNKKTIRAYEPEKVFASDGLRLLRAVRFGAELNFDIETKTYNAIKNNYYLLNDIKSERIYEEFYKILISDSKYPQNNTQISHYKGIKLLKELILLPIIIPQIELGYDVKQRKDYHKYDVFEHTAQTVKFSHIDIRLPALLHDIGKGICYKENGNFYNHENVGAIAAEKILGQQGLKCPNKVIKENVFLIKYHMYDLNCKTSESKIKLFIAKNQNYIEKLLLLKQADYLGCGLKHDICPTVLRWKEIKKQMKADRTPFSLQELSIGGIELIELGCKAENISEILNILLNECILNPALNKKEILIQKTKRYILNYNKKAKL